MYESRKSNFLFIRRWITGEKKGHVGLNVYPTNMSDEGQEGEKKSWVGLCLVDDRIVWQ